MQRRGARGGVRRSLDGEPLGRDSCLFAVYCREPHARPGREYATFLGRRGGAKLRLIFPFRFGHLPGFDCPHVLAILCLPLARSLEEEPVGDAWAGMSLPAWLAERYWLGQTGKKRPFCGFGHLEWV